ncbi:MAG: (Fe-S)-binding protein [Desulfobacterales bacterium RIFOXYA12_FULL_46_15]|nr:MAG: (Fe-S)-binding protein [Desulfobacterales bacterium RIFOXYA12_FULL_46_15]
MDKMKKLSQDVKKLEKELALCTRCGICQANCPLFESTRKEADVSRGKLVLIHGLIDGLFKDAKGVNKRLQRCLLCGSCAHGCPSGVNTVEIFLKARVVIAQYLGMPFAKKLVFRKILSSPEKFNGLMALAGAFQKFFFKDEENLQGTSCARVASPLLRNRHLVLLKENAFNRNFYKHDFRVEGKGVKVAFFVGCLIDKAFPNIGHSVVDVLNHFHAGIFVPRGQGCCGIPALAAGDMKTFEALVRLHVDLFSKEKFDYLVTACATCSSTIIKLWPSLFKDKDKDLQKKIEALAGKTVDISRFMGKHFDLVSAVPRQKNQIMTYHDPCHLKKSLGISDDPRQVILASGNVLLEMKNSDACCGMGGSFNLMHYDLSTAIGRIKAENIIDTGCTTVATSCPACMMQISDMLAKKTKSIRVKHPVEIYAEALAGG